ncbi:hypothetical protein VTN49DRAFT_6249 [Thermomyces lanuginosus]|uniref:uncharacterized protein n=1 Tax=Thermomyces lanuginosus TaxID=5541 RepID=UPI00374201FA
MANLPPTRPYILLLSLAMQPWFDEMYTPLLRKLGDKAKVERITDEAEAIQQLDAIKKVQYQNRNPSQNQNQNQSQSQSQNQNQNQRRQREQQVPRAILVTDQRITEKNCPMRLVNLLKLYMGGGGTVILCCTFSNLSRWPDMDHFFRTKLDVPWVVSKYTREDLCLNLESYRLSGLIRRHRSLHDTSNQKAVFLKYVHIEDALYVEKPYVDEDEDDEYYSSIDPPPPEPLRTPVVFAPYGNGHVGYVGDVNQEEETDEVLLAMCDL